MKKVCLVTLVLLLGLFVQPRASHAETMTWTVTSNYQYQVQIEFYAQSRSAAWPGNGRAYDLNDYNAHSFAINCRAGEKVCYGAWPTGGNSSGTYWGVGRNNRQRCSNCCAICGEEDPVKNLTQ